MSITLKERSPSLPSPSRRSRVTPGRSSTSARRAPTRRLNRVDLPTLGRPTMATVKDMMRSGGKSQKPSRWRGARLSVQTALLSRSRQCVAGGRRIGPHRLSAAHSAGPTRLAAGFGQAVCGCAARGAGGSGRLIKGRVLRRAWAARSRTFGFGLGLGFGFGSAFACASGALAAASPLSAACSGGGW